VGGGVTKRDKRIKFFFKYFNLTLDLKLMSFQYPIGEFMGENSPGGVYGRKIMAH
jgi:hypothetical protein